MIPVLAEAALRSLLLGVFVALALRALRVHSPRLQRLAWVGVLVGALFIPVLMRCSIAPAVVISAVDVAGVASHATQLSEGFHWQDAVLAIYCVVALALLARFALGLCRMGQVVRRAEPVAVGEAARVDVRSSREVSSPLTFGSIVVLPADYGSWSHQKRAAILMHECAHVLHYDCQVQWLATIHACVFWFSPMAWWLRRRLTELAEHISDDVVIGNSGDPASYAAILLEMGGERSGGRIAAAMAHVGVPTRIDRILADEYRIRGCSGWQRGVAVAAVAVVVALTSMVVRVSGAEPATSRHDERARPSIAGSPPLEQMFKWYPKEAERRHIEGMVTISVTLDPVGRPTDTLILSETPKNMGFGAAASGVAHELTYANPTGRRTGFTLNVKFSLPPRK